MINKKRIEQVLDVLIGMELKDIGRAADLEWFVFGPTNTSVPSATDKPKASDCTLHAECSWRIVGLEGIVVASRDRFYPAGSDPFKDLLDFDWDVPGSNRCDERVANFIKEKVDTSMIVSEIVADNIGSLCIKLSGSYKIELFPDDSLGKEYWRFFKLNSNATHFIFTGNGIQTVGK